VSCPPGSRGRQWLEWTGPTGLLLTHRSKRVKPAARAEPRLSARAACRGRPGKGAAVRRFGKAETSGRSALGLRVSATGACSRLFSVEKGKAGESRLPRRTDGAGKGRPLPAETKAPAGSHRTGRPKPGLAYGLETGKLNRGAGALATATRMALTKWARGIQSKPKEGPRRREDHLGVNDERTRPMLIQATPVLLVACTFFSGTSSPYGRKRKSETAEAGGVLPDLRTVAGVMRHGRARPTGGFIDGQLRPGCSRRKMA